MIKDYCTLKQHCLVPYSIKGEKFNVGDMTDRQLDISEKILRRKDSLTKEEIRQLNAIRYVKSYRDTKAHDSALRIINDDTNKRLLKNAEKKATIIADNIKISEKQKTY
jgi:hypothetical protein